MEILFLVMGVMGGICIHALLLQGSQKITIRDPDYVDISNLTYDDKASIRHQVEWFEESYHAVEQKNR